MLKKKERLDRTTFSRLFSIGKRYHSPSLLLVYIPEGTFRASAVVSKKIAKSAVLRNKFRRRIYDAFGRIHAQKQLSGVFICIAKEGAPARPYADLKEEILDLVHKTGVLR